MNGQTVLREASERLGRSSSCEWRFEQVDHGVGVNSKAELGSTAKRVYIYVIPLVGAMPKIPMHRALAMGGWKTSQPLSWLFRFSVSLVARTAPKDPAVSPRATSVIARLSAPC